MGSLALYPGGPEIAETSEEQPSLVVRYEACIQKLEAGIVAREFWWLGSSRPCVSS